MKEDNKDRKGKVFSTERQKKAVAFCECFTDGKFEGDIDDFYEVSEFLSIWLEYAKSMYHEVEGLDYNDIY